MHEEWTDKLSDFLDGELTPEEHRAVEAHLRGCAACAGVLDDLKRVVARARAAGAAARPPAADLWSGIAARIEPQPASTDPVAAFAPRARRRIAFTLPQLAAAASLIAAVSGGLVWQIGERRARVAPAPVEARRGPDPAAPGSAAPTPDTSAADHVVPVVLADAQYDAAVSDLEKAVKEGRGRLDAATIAIVEQNLQIIDRAIDQAREALAADPVNTYLSGHLVEARRRKLDLLRRAAALTSESD